jgi:hypothetical protein
VNDAELRELQREGKSDPAARFRFFGAPDRKLSPELGPLTEETVLATNRFVRMLVALLRSTNGRRDGGHVKPRDLAGVLARTDELPEREGVRWVWLEGPPPFGRSAAHTVVLAVIEDGSVAIGAHLKSTSIHVSNWLVQALPRGDEGTDVGARWSILERDSEPALYVAWARGRGEDHVRAPIRVPVDVAVRWARRLTWTETPPSRSS